MGSLSAVCESNDSQINTSIVPTTIPIRITARDYRTIRNYNSGILSNRCNLRKIKLSSNASYTYQELNKYPIPSIMKPRKSKRPQGTEYYTEGSLDEKSVTRIGSCQEGECLDALAKNFIPASAWRHSPP